MDGMMDDVTMANMVNEGGGGPAAVISAAAAYNNANAVANAVNGRNSNHIQPRQRESNRGSGYLVITQSLFRV